MASSSDSVKPWPLPNDVFDVGDRCPRSLNGITGETIAPTNEPRWGVCLGCGEVVNLLNVKAFGEYRIPEHVIPTVERLAEVPNGR